jgi:hypothetical protein
VSVIYREAAKADLEGMARIRAAERGEQEDWEKYIWGYMQGSVFPQKALEATGVVHSRRREPSGRLYCGAFDETI